MPTLELLQSFPTNRQELLNALGTVNPFESRLITLYLDKGDPLLPSSITFQVPVTIKNIMTHQCNRCRRIHLGRVLKRLENIGLTLS